MTRIPTLLIYYRLLAALGILLIGVVFQNQTTILILLLITGLLSDVFDGIIARKLQVATIKLRRIDSIVDQFFWLAVGVTLLFLHYEFIAMRWVGFVTVLTAELLTYLVAYVKFKKEVATHSWGAKLWTLSMLAFVLDLLISQQANFSYYIWLTLGLLSRAEIIGILFTLKKWQADVPSLWHAINIYKKVDYTE